MKNKKILTVLVAVAVLQLIFPLGFFVREKVSIDGVVEKGKAYTLSYTMVDHMTNEYLSVNTPYIYNVKWQTGGVTSYTEGYDVEYDPVAFFSEVGICENEDGSVGFFSIEDGEAELTKYNWFNTDVLTSLNFDEYEFVREDFGMKELFDLCSSTIYENYYYEDRKPDWEEFINAEDYCALYESKIEGKITLLVYNGYAKISELYIGDELILKLK